MDARALASGQIIDGDTHAARHPARDGVLHHGLQALGQHPIGRKGGRAAVMAAACRLPAVSSTGPVFPGSRRLIAERPRRPTGGRRRAADGCRRSDAPAGREQRHSGEAAHPQYAAP